MKKNLILSALAVMTISGKAQTTFLGAPTTTYGAIYRSGNISVGASNNLGYPADNTGSMHKLGIYTTDGSGLGVIETGGGNANLTLRSALSPNDYAWSLNTLNSGDFKLQKENTTSPALFISGSTGRITLGGNTSPNASLHIGDGAGSLHYGNLGVLMKFASGDRTLLELHDPSDANRLIIQSLAGASYLTSIDAKPLNIQTSGGQIFFGIKRIQAGHVHANSDYQFDGKVACKELVVIDPSKWADYVFSAGYKLKSLDEVEAFYKKNRHLPDVPSEEEVKENGINSAEMDATLLQKIEELYLHIVEQNKRIEKLEKQNKDLRNRK